MYPFPHVPPVSLSLSLSLSLSRSLLVSLPTGSMLNEGIREAFQGGVARVAATPGVERLTDERHVQVKATY